MATTYDVNLYIYDLSQGFAKTLAPILLRKKIEGIWHTGIVVYGREYFYGSNGIQYVDPGGTILGHTYKILKMGKTEVTVDIFDDYLRDLSVEKFRDNKYHLMDHNCNTFSNTVVSFLLHKHIPQYIINLPKEIQQTQMGTFLRPVLDNLYRGQRMFGGQGNALGVNDGRASSSKVTYASDDSSKKPDKKDKKNKNVNNVDETDLTKDHEVDNSGGSVCNKEVEERKMKIERLLKETLHKFSQDKLDVVNTEK